MNNQFTGAFSYAMAISSAINFTVANNVLIGNTSFIGARGPNCSNSDTTPTPAAFVFDQNNTQMDNVQSDFQIIPDGSSLTCVLPPDGGDFWPYGGNPASNSTSPVSPPSPQPSSPSTSGGNSSKGRTIGIVLGIVLGLLFVAVVSWFLRKWALKRAEAKNHFNASKSGYVRSKEET